MDNTTLGDRMKMYETRESKRRLLPNLPVCARIDGKCFSTWTKHLRKPYDPDFIKIMTEVTKKLVQDTNACVGYTQSDEINLAWYNDNPKGQIWFNGRINKMNSVLASKTSIYFRYYVREYLPDKIEDMAFFDSRVWAVPNLVEASNVFVWRELDAIKNSIASAAQSVYSHKQLFKKNQNDMQNMLIDKGINWNDYPSEFKRGVYIQRKKILKKFSCDEIEQLPEKHEAHSNPNLKVKRTIYDKINLPPITKIVNRVDVLFNGDKPIINEEKK